MRWSEQCNNRRWVRYDNFTMRQLLGFYGFLIYFAFSLIPTSNSQTIRHLPERQTPVATSCLLPICPRLLSCWQLLGLEFRPQLPLTKSFWFDNFTMLNFNNSFSNSNNKPLERQLTPESADWIHHSADSKAFLLQFCTLGSFFHLILLFWSRHRCFVFIVQIRRPIDWLTDYQILATINKN
jgi:hypothetical protein